MKNDFLKLGFHGAEGFVVLIGGIGALNVSDGAVGAEAGKSVDVAISIVAGEVAVVEPQDALGMEVMQETTLYLVTRQIGIAVGREEALTGGHECATPVTLDAAAFEDEVEVGLVGTF